MGCGASAHTQGSKPLRPGADSQEQRNNKPSPIAEDVRTVQDQGLKEAGQPTGVPPGAPATPSQDGAVTTDGQQPSGPLKPPESPSAASGADAGYGSAAVGDGQPALDQIQEPREPLSQQQSGGLNIVEAVRATSSSDFGRRSPAMPSLADSVAAGSGGGAPLYDPAVTPNSENATVTLLPDAMLHGGFVSRPRYANESELSITTTSYDLTGQGADSDSDDELAALFTMASWKRYYSYNKKKPKDLLAYFWRRYPPQEFSCFCISYRNQDMLLTRYMADNLVNGYCARVEDMGLSDSIFLQMYTLRDYDADLYRIVGLLLVAGPALPPPLASLSAFDGFVYHRADTSLVPVRQFMSALLVGLSPLNSLELMHSREVT